jgi:hypothetical protein
MHHIMIRAQVSFSSFAQVRASGLKSNPLLVSKPTLRLLPLRNAKTDAYLYCSDKQYEAKYPPVGLHPPSDFVKKFFIFSFGTHLAEGSNSQIYYNLNVTECAIECLSSASDPSGDRAPGGARCLSFDFYPFEDPINNGPLFESLERGVCILNTGK